MSKRKLNLDEVKWMDMADNNASKLDDLVENLANTSRKSHDEGVSDVTGAILLCLIESGCSIAKDKELNRRHKTKFKNATLNEYLLAVCEDTRGFISRIVVNDIFWVLRDYGYVVKI